MGNIMNIHCFIIIFLLNILFYCGNPRVHYSIIKYKKSGDPDKVSSALTRESKYGKSAESLVRMTDPEDGISIDVNNEYALWFGFLNQKIFSYLSSLTDMQINKNFRWPKLQYFTFQFKYYGKKSMEVDFFRVYFIDEFGREYRAIPEKEFKKKYTSITYSWLDYQKFFVPYKKVDKGSENKYLPIKQTNAIKNKKVKKNDEIPMVLRHKTKIIINNSQEEIFHIVPFPDFFIGSKKFRLIFNFKIDGETKQIDMPFVYVSSREDIKENSFKTR